MWRGRHQSNVFQMFMLLCLHGLCTLKFLEKPALCNSPLSSSVRYVKSALLCFDGPRQMLGQGKDFVPFDDPQLTWNSFEGPLDWLAIMIARTTRSLHATLNFIHSSRHFGNCSKAKVDSLPEMTDQIQFPDPNACVVRGSPPCFGFMLPHGIVISEGDNDFPLIHKLFYSHLKRIEQAYDAFFGVPESARLSLQYQKDINKDVRDWNPADVFRLLSAPNTGLEMCGESFSTELFHGWISVLRKDPEKGDLTPQT